MSVKASSTDALEDAIGGDAEISDADDAGNTDPQGDNRKGALRGVAKGETPYQAMNQTETRFAGILAACDSVQWWAYEIFRVHYGDKGWHTPDFLVLLDDDQLMIAEVKGHMTDAGRTRFKAGARALPILRWAMYVQTGKRQPWTCKYDTENQNGAPILT